MSLWRWWADRANYIHPLHFKWPSRSRGVKVDRCLMDEITMHLAGVTSFGMSDGVSDHLRPIISQPLKSIRKFWARLMGSAHTVMGFFQYLLCLFL